MSATETKYRICPVCEATCGLQIDVQGREVGDIRGNADDVFSHGFICPKGVALRELDSDPDRLRHPLVRRGGELKKATWEEAFAEIENRVRPLLAEHGNGGMAAYLGNPSAHKVELQLYIPIFLKALATRQIYSASTLDQMPKQVSNGLMYGHILSAAVPDIDRCDHLVIMGANPMASNGSLWTVPDFRGRVKALKARGGTLTVIDPKKTATAKLADKHMAIVPGTDAYLLASIVNVLYAEDLVNLGDAGEYINGVDAVRDAVASYTPESVAQKTLIDADTIRQLARDFASAKSGAFYGRIGTCVQEFGTLASWLVDVINILTGNLDRPGGVMFPRAVALQGNSSGKPRVGRGFALGRWKSRVRGAAEAMSEIPAVCLAEEIETPGDGQIRALFTLAGNPVLSAPNGARLARALDSLDFMVSIDIYLNETTRHADVILPGTSALESCHFDVGFNQFSIRNTARFSPALFPYADDRPSEWEVMLRLAAIVSGSTATPQEMDDELMRGKIQGMVQKEGSALAERDVDELYNILSVFKGPERQVDLALRTGPFGDLFGANPEGLNLQTLIDTPNGVDLGPLEPRLPDVLRTPSGMIELSPHELLGDMERLSAGLTAPTEDNMLLIGRRHVRTNNSWMHNLPLLAKGPNKCTMEINSQDAERLGIQDGSTAAVSNNGQTVKVVAEVTNDIMPGVISIPHGFGHSVAGTNLQVAADRPGVNSNLLADDQKIDPLSGNAILNGIPVTVAAA